MHAYFLPRYEYAAAALRSWRFPLWNPFEFCGEPFFASPQSGTLYPPVDLLFSLLPVRAALQWLWGLHAFLVSWATVAYLRGHVASPLARVVGAFVALAGILRGSPSVIDQPQFFAGAAWLPCLLLCWERAVRRGTAPWLGLLALSAAAQWFSGYPDFAMDGAVLLGLVALLDDGGTVARRVGILVAGLAAGAGLSAVQLLALAEAVRESVRFDEHHAYSAFRAAVFAVHSASQLGRALLAHHGAAALALAAVALLRPSRVRVAWCVAFLWALFALNPPLSLLYRLPPFAESRLPLGWGCIAPLFLGFLAAAGIDIAWSRRRMVVRAAVVVLGLAATLHAARVLWAAPEAAPYPAPDYELVARRVPVLERLRKLTGSDARVLSVRERVSGVHMRYGIPSPGGYDPLAPRRVQHLLGKVGITLGMVSSWSDIAAHADLAARLGLGIVVVERARIAEFMRAGFAPLAALPPDDVAMYRRPVPRAHLVHRVTVVTNDAESLEWVAAHARDVNAAVVVDGDEPTATLADPMAPEHATITTNEPETVAVQALVASPGLLVLRDTWYPGWTATVDGLPARVLRVDHAFRGVALESGDHEVVFHYKPTWLVMGMAASLSSAALTVLFLLVSDRSWAAAAYRWRATAAARPSRSASEM